jgi:NDP-sugar pyrophosphorylase family protein
MKAVILCGGAGTRMASITKGAPKALIDVHGRAVIEHIFDLLKRHGITDVVLAVGCGAEAIREKFGDGSGYGLSIAYTEEKEPLGTAGPLRLAGRMLQDSFIVSNGDELKDIHLDRMLEFHRNRRALATIALTKVKNTSEYGIVEMEGDRIKRFVEKPRPEEAPSNLANAGLYIMEPEVIKMIPSGLVMLEKDIFPEIAAMGRLFGFPFSGQWFDTGTPGRYARAIKEWRGIPSSRFHGSYAKDPAVCQRKPV